MRIFFYHRRRLPLKVLREDTSHLFLHTSYVREGYTLIVYLVLWAILKERSTKDVVDV